MFNSVAFDPKIIEILELVKTDAAEELLGEAFMKEVEDFSIGESKGIVSKSAHFAVHVVGNGFVVSLLNGDEVGADLAFLMGRFERGEDPGFELIVGFDV